MINDPMDTMYDVSAESGKFEVKINPANKGKFKKYCKETTGSDVITDECIEKGLASPDPKVRKEALFVKNSRKWKHKKKKKDGKA